MPMGTQPEEKHIVDTWKFRDRLCGLPVFSCYAAPPHERRREGMTDKTREAIAEVLISAKRTDRIEILTASRPHYGPGGLSCML